MKNIELNVNCLKSDKAKRLKELESMVYELDCTVDSQLFVEQMQIAVKRSAKLGS
ncbi:hypothetical protein [Aliarcobacter cryaerophilus]|uniref:hypothetical protein n=1 Tax=Aliarcobacter cryaerophilus TaxID=28198 RepID=UPI003DA2EA44